MNLTFCYDKEDPVDDKAIVSDLQTGWEEISEEMCMKTAAKMGWDLGRVGRDTVNGPDAETLLGLRNRPEGKVINIEGLKWNPKMRSITMAYRDAADPQLQDPDVVDKIMR